MRGVACSSRAHQAGVCHKVDATSSAEERNFSAIVRARVETDLSFRAGGKVTERLVDVGQSVKMGQPLARLDAVDYQLALSAAADQVRAAEVDATQAASDEGRFRRLLVDGSVGAADHERQKARADAAAARWDQARRQLELARNRDGYTTLIAPYDGVVTSMRFERGQVVTEGQSVLSLARDGEREVVADIPEEWVGRVRTSVASAKSWSGVGAPVKLQLRELSPLASVQGRTFRARYAAAGGAGEVLGRMPLGSTAELRLVASAAGALSFVIPVPALIKIKDQSGVWVLNPGGTNLVFTPVTVQAVTASTVRVNGSAPACAL